MAETALDLSISQTSLRLHTRIPSDSGRTSADSSASEYITEDRLLPAISIKTRISPPVGAPHSVSLGQGHPLGDSNSASSEEDLKMTGNQKGGPERVAPIRPFKMYPIDSFSMYGPLMAGAVSTMATSGLTPSMSLPSLYDPASASPGFSNFALTPLTSHLLQRKRRQENRDREKDTNGGNGSLNPQPSSSPSCHSDSESDSKKSKTVPDEKKDDAYWERRRKNNEAAKRSRDARRQKEEEIAMRAAFLEQENLKLRAQVAILKNETAKLHYMLYNRL